MKKHGERLRRKGLPWRRRSAREYEEKRKSWPKRDPGKRLGELGNSRNVMHKLDYGRKRRRRRSEGLKRLLGKQDWKKRRRH